VGERPSRDLGLLAPVSNRATFLLGVLAISAGLLVIWVLAEAPRELGEGTGHAMLYWPIGTYLLYRSGSRVGRSRLLRVVAGTAIACVCAAPCSTPVWRLSRRELCDAGVSFGCRALSLNLRDPELMLAACRLRDVHSCLSYAKRPNVQIDDVCAAARYDCIEFREFGECRELSSLCGEQWASRIRSR
jgi:hypothetical protein